MVLSRIRPVEPLPAPAPINIERTLITCRFVRRIYKAYQKDLTAKRLNFIIHANLRLAALNSIAKHINVGLVRSLKMEKRKRSRRKKLGLIREEVVRS